MAFGRHCDVIRWHQIIARLNPPPPIALGATHANRALAHQINLAVPLAIARTDRAKRIKIARARNGRDAVKRMAIMRAGAVDDALNVGHGAKLGRLGHIRNLALQTDAKRIVEAFHHRLFGQSSQWHPHPRGTKRRDAAIQNSRCVSVFWGGARGKRICGGVMTVTRVRDPDSVSSVRQKENRNAKLEAHRRPLIRCSWF